MMWLLWKYTYVHPSDVWSFKTMYAMHLHAGFFVRKPILQSDLTVIIRWISVFMYTIICYHSQNPRVQRVCTTVRYWSLFWSRQNNFHLPSYLGVVYLLYMLCVLRCLVCIVVSCLVCIVVVVLCVLLLSYVYLLYYVCIAVFTLNAGLLTRNQYPEGPATGHLDTGFSCFPCVYKQMLRWFPRFQVATTCLLCSHPDLNLLVTNFIFCVHVK